MNYFRTMPTILRAQREELEAVHRELCQDVSEISGVIRQLDTMSAFDGVIQTLRRVQKTGGEQQAKLRKSARVLEQAAELYTRTELRNMDCGAGFSPAETRRASQAEWNVPAPSAVEMVPNARAFFGMEIVIPPRTEGG